MPWVLLIDAVLLIQSGQKWHFPISLEVQWLVAEKLGHNSAFVWAFSTLLERLMSLQDSLLLPVRWRLFFKSVHSLRAFTFTKKDVDKLAQRSQQLCYCLFHCQHLHQPYPSCPPPSLCSGLSPLPSQQVLISVYDDQGTQDWLEWHTTSHYLEHCPERSINLLSTVSPTESRYSFLTDQIQTSTFFFKDPT